MKKIVGSRLPSFDQIESRLVKGSADFLAINFYFAEKVKDSPQSLEIQPKDYKADIAVELDCQRMQRNSSLEDWPRVKCLQGYIGAVLDSLRNGSDVRGYFTWSLLDVFELLDGYNSGFGLYYVDLDDPDLKRCPKLSARWYSHFLKGGSQGPGSGSLIEQLQDNSSSVSPDHGLIH
ncbi:hypothetical protein CRG98_021888 [Punica granatum]|uniref:Uncharacterized protein n=1 Tax=Punica granatum TaxID=22663 RepID=A0A2I0JNJ3_PUNGR|nr:hypothetical protein CRG98_021888 [Punica granatum]